ncbi:hypothetical protein LTR85_001204 [Meristemomyces frigidus]|nr:hypothetical protein LTR85_001204 [Meristemomyces frigidus]
MLSIASTMEISPLAQAKAMNETGLLHRNATDYLQENTTQFPGGMKKWTESINQYGVSGLAYSIDGYLTCAGYPAAYGHEEQDLEMWRSWGWNHMVKYDDRFIPFDNVTIENEYGRYKQMADAFDNRAAKYDEKPFI